MEDKIIEEVAIKPGECTGECVIKNGCGVSWCVICGWDDL